MITDVPIEYNINFRNCEMSIENLRVYVKIFHESEIYDLTNWENYDSGAIEAVIIKDSNIAEAKKFWKKFNKEKIKEVKAKLKVKIS